MANIGTAAAVVAAARVRNLRRDGTASSFTALESFLDMHPPVDILGGASTGFSASTRGRFVGVPLSFL
jgi:hypothetical protein